MSMTTQVSRTVSSCFAALRHIRSIRRSVSQQCQPVLRSFVTSLVLSRLDYGSVTLNGITIKASDGSSAVRAVLNATARLVYNSRVSTIGSRRSCATCTGCAFLNGVNASTSVWPFLCSAAVTCRPHLNTSPETCCSGLMTTSLADEYDRHKMVVRRTPLRTIGDRSFGAAAPRMWNNLPTDVITASSVATFKQRLKTFSFAQSFDV